MPVDAQSAEREKDTFRERARYFCHVLCTKRVWEKGGA